MKTEPTYISSRTNPTVVRLASLIQKKNRTEYGLFVIEGKKLCREAIGKSKIKYVLLKEDAMDDDLRHISEEAEKSGAETIILSDGAFMKISSDSTPDGIIFVSSLPDTEEMPEKTERILALECVRDPGNVGTVIRSAAAFGFDRIILADCADLTNPKTVRATMGALFNMKFTVCESMRDVIPKLKADGRRIVGAALSDDSFILGKGTLCENDCPVIGNEGHGISDETLSFCDAVVTIPMSGKTESLNAASAACVIAWEYFRNFGNK